MRHEKRISNLSLLAVLAVVGFSTIQVGASNLFYSTAEAANTGAHSTKKQVAATEGNASFYAGEFHGRKTANGETFNANQLTAAHPSLPFGTWVKVTNLSNGKDVVVRINDRGPFIKGRIIDLSGSAAKRIGIMQTGIVQVKLEAIKLLPPAFISG
ncbi:MAG: septal ring lytic transglycosylase RlpA family protein [Chlorobium sp.]|nr:MAG: septal ring lytic transglycosylase RlpA family protein [Chlorobium sp.]